MGAQFLSPRIPHLNSAAVSFAAGGDNTVVAAIASTRILVHRLFFVVAGTTSITIKNGAGTSLTGAMPFVANGALILDISGEPWFTTSKGNAFVINLSSGVQVSGTVYYATSI